MQALLSEEELEFWREYHLRWPIDDMHRIYRPAALIVSAGAGKGASDAFNRSLDVLAPKPKPPARKLRPARIIKHKE